MNHAKLEAIICLIEAANYLDKVWRDCRIASTIGNSAGILGGVLTIGGGTATGFSAGADGRDFAWSSCCWHSGRGGCCQL